jgi:small subunit ribosomal protein S9
LTTTDTTEAPSEASVEVEDQAPAPAPAPTPESAPASKPSKPITQTTGRRKRAVARVRLRPGNGKITVNRRSFEDYFTSATHRMIVSEPLRISNIAERYDIDVTMDGGGTSGQAGALRLGITRALVEIDPELRTSLKRAGLLTRDAREKESKKYGLKKARKAPQYSKR